MTKTRTNRTVGAFIRGQEGSATIETVLWLPFFIGIFGLIVDASLMFNAQAALTRTVQDANRAYSIGRIASASEAEAYVMARVGAAKNDTETTVVTTVTNGVINTTVTVAAGHYMAVGLFDAITNMKLNITAQHLMET